MTFDPAVWRLCWERRRWRWPRPGTVVISLAPSLSYRMSGPCHFQVGSDLLTVEPHIVFKQTGRCKTW